MVYPGGHGQFSNELAVSCDTKPTELSISSNPVTHQILVSRVSVKSGLAQTRNFSGCDYLGFRICHLLIRPNQLGTRIAWNTMLIKVYLK